TERDVRLQADRLAAKLAHPDLESGSRAERRLLEQHRHVPAGRRRRGRGLDAEPACGFEAPGQLEAALEVGRTEIENGEEVLPGGDRLCHDVVASVRSWAV